MSMQRPHLAAFTLITTGFVTLVPAIAAAQGAPVAPPAEPAPAPVEPEAAPAPVAPEPAPAPVAPAPAPVAVAAPAPTPPAKAPAPAKADHPDLTVKSYGELQFAWFDHGPNQNRSGGAQRDSRLEFDTTRFVLELEYHLPRDIEIEAEIEFEHGGTGSALELEYDEFGEFESEVEKGGEVLIEELYIQKIFAGRHALKVGRFYVAMGLLSEDTRPTAYLGAMRSEAETTLIPAVWDEMGISYTGFLGVVRATAQIVSGLDSTGFSSQRFVALGHQRRFETVRATDLAYVGRLDYTGTPGVLAGVSAYYGGTTRNRPKPDLVESCATPDPDVVASCGYTEAPLLLLDAHASFRLGPVRGQALLLWGRLWNANDVSERNKRLSNELGVPRTPIADQGLAAWGEVGVDVAPWLGASAAHVIEPYLRFDYVDTMFKTRANLFDNPRFERKLLSFGVSYLLGQTVFAKLEFGHRWFGSSDLRSENTVRLSTGFVY